MSKEKKDKNIINNATVYGEDTRSFNSAYVTQPQTIDGKIGRWLLVGDKVNLLGSIKGWIALQEQSEDSNNEEIGFAKRLLVFLSGTDETYTK